MVVCDSFWTLVSYVYSSRNDGMEDCYSILIRFDEQKAADTFHKHFSGRRFSSLEVWVLKSSLLLWHHIRYLITSITSFFSYSLLFYCFFACRKRRAMSYLLLMFITPVQLSTHSPYLQALQSNRSVLFVLVFYLI